MSGGWDVDHDGANMPRYLVTSTCSIVIKHALILMSVISGWSSGAVVKPRISMDV